jgi:hypothetical protein
MYQNMLNLVCLLDLDADPNAVDAWLNKDSLILIPGNGQGIQENLRGCLRLDLWNIVPFRGLG